MHPADRDRYERAISELKDALPPTELQNAWDQGQRLTLEELVKEAGAGPAA